GYNQDDVSRGTSYMRKLVRPDDQSQLRIQAGVECHIAGSHLNCDGLLVLLDVDSRASVELKPVPGDQHDFRESVGTGLQFVAAEDGGFLRNRDSSNANRTDSANRS